MFFATFLHLKTRKISLVFYDDVRDKLTKGDLKEHEVAFMHDYNTYAKKKELFEKVNKGEVRVLLGSTLKMETGMNVQQKLVVLHHLDVPWRPLYLEQREGRILKQGNKILDNFKISIYCYATERTYDARMWQILENKAKFINEFQKGSFKG